MLQAAEDASPAAWLTRAAGEPYTVHSMVPDVFEAYARVFHPAELCQREVRWSEVAAANGRTMHGAAEWGSLTGSWQLRDQEGLWDGEPERGKTPERLALRLAAVLAEHTTTPERCWFAVWEGWGESWPLLLFKEGTSDEERARALKEVEELRERASRWESVVHGAASFELPLQRGMHLLWGRLAEIAAFYPEAESHPLQDRNAPGIWWPEDRAWCVGGDVDLMTTYVGGTRAAVAALVGDERLEALEIPAGQGVTWEADTLNPLPAAPS